MQKNFKEAMRLARSKSRSAAAGFALVAVACVAIWGFVSKIERGMERAQGQAVRAVEWSLAGEGSKLRQAMTEEAAAKALDERRTAQLDEVLARSGARVKAQAQVVEASVSGAEWKVRGLATASIEGSGSPQAPWRGAWSARLSPDADGDLKVSLLRVSSLPESAGYDAQGMSQALAPRLSHTSEAAP